MEPDGTLERLGKRGPLATKNDTHDRPRVGEVARPQPAALAATDSFPMLISPVPPTVIPLHPAASGWPTPTRHTLAVFLPQVADAGIPARDRCRSW